MLLARKGYRVLVVDRAHFPSDTVSTHLVHAPGVAALERWGLRDRLVATRRPPIATYSFDLGPFVIRGTPQAADDVAVAYRPRRAILDKLLLDAAARAGADVREDFVVDELLVDHGQVVGIRGHGPTGARIEEHARIVVGRTAPILGSRRRSAPSATTKKPVLAVANYSYRSGFPVDDAEWMLRPGYGYGAFPTNHDLTMVLAAWPHASLQTIKRDIDGSYHRAVADAFGDRAAGARREERIIGSGVPNHFRIPYGPGWVLVGDAGYVKDPVTAQGITDAFLHAELCATAIDTALSGDQSYAYAMAAYHRKRHAEVAPIYDFTTQLATLEPPPPPLQQVLRSIAGNQPAMDQFASLFTGTVAPDGVLRGEPRRSARRAARRGVAAALNRDAGTPWVRHLASAGQLMASAWHRATSRGCAAVSKPLAAARKWSRAPCRSPRARAR